jgi:hypothetical protein
VEVRQRRRRPGWLDQRQDGRQEQSDSCSRSHLLERTARQTCEHHMYVYIMLAQKKCIEKN